MAEAYEWCDVVVSRAGASSVLEIEAVNRPAIFVPYPFQQGTHQTDNAMTLVDQGKALIVEEGDGFVDKLKGSLAEIFDRNRFCEIKKKPHESRSLDAAERIAEGCLALAAHKH